MTGKWEILIKCKTVRATCKNLELWTELSCLSVPSLRCISWPRAVHFQLRAGYAPATHLAPSPLFPSKGKLQCDLDDCGTRTSSALFPELGRYESQEILLNPWETYWCLSEDSGGAMDFSSPQAGRTWSLNPYGPAALTIPQGYMMLPNMFSRVLL